MRDSFELVIIGGGINGAALAEAAAHGGYGVALLERADFGAGVTSRSTRLIHGGLRYLEHGHFGVVRESLREREALLEEFPFQVEPLEFLIPVYRADSRARLWVRLGLEAYQWIGRSRRLGRHRQLSADEALALEPGLKRDGLCGGFVYYDCRSLYPERLALEMALEARALGAEVRNHAPVAGLAAQPDGGVAVRLASGESCRARLVINAAGPWADQVRQMWSGASSPNGRRLLRLIGGCHIVTAAFSGAPSRAIYHEASADRRPFFIVPWRGLWLIGTTETPHAGDPGAVAPTAAEIDYLLRETNLLLPRAGLSRPSVLYAYAGLRPLLDSSSSQARAISRGHAVYDHEQEGRPGMITMLGGKLTTARAFAAETLEVVAAKLGRPPRERARRAPWDAAAVPERLARIYGRRALDIVALMRRDPALDRPICPAAETTAAEIIHAARNENARTLGDILLRRTGLAFAPCLGLDCAPQAARLAAPALGWDEAAMAAAVADYHQELGGTLYRKCPA